MCIRLYFNGTGYRDLQEFVSAVGDLEKVTITDSHTYVGHRPARADEQNCCCDVDLVRTAWALHRVAQPSFHGQMGTPLDNWLDPVLVDQATLDQKYGAGTFAAIRQEMAAHLKISEPRDKDTPS